MTTVYCAEHYGYGRTKHGRCGECGCHRCRAVRAQKVTNRKRILREQRGLTKSGINELKEEIRCALPVA